MKQNLNTFQTVFKRHSGGLGRNTTQLHFAVLLALINLDNILSIIDFLLKLV